VTADSNDALSISLSEPEDGVLMVGLSGDLDITTVGAFAQRVGDLGWNGTPSVVVDLSALQFIDSSGLNALVTSARRIEENGGWIVFAGAGTHVSRVLDVVRLGESVAVEQSLEVALRRAAGESSVRR